MYMAGHRANFSTLMDHRASSRLAGANAEAPQAQGRCALHLMCLSIDTCQPAADPAVQGQQQQQPSGLQPHLK